MSYDAQRKPKSIWRKQFSKTISVFWIKSEGQLRNSEITGIPPANFLQQIQTFLRLHDRQKVEGCQACHYKTITSR